MVGVSAWAMLPRGWMPGLDGSVGQVAALIRSWGVWGVLGSIALMTIHSFLPFPAEIVALANGLVYGPLWGAVITWVGAMIGASAAFALARWLGRPFVRRMLSAGQQQRLAAWSHTQGGLALLICRLIPVLAFNLINYAAALTEISWWTFLWATGLGILPLTLLLSIVGNRMNQWPPWIWFAFGMAVLSGWFILARWRRMHHRRHRR